MNGHEDIPVVSELWYEIMIQFSVTAKKRLSALKHLTTKRNMFFINHSEMLPECKYYSNVNFHKGNQQMLDLYMQSCNKFAITPNENMAIELHTKLKAFTKPVYYGVDIVNENLIKYK